MDLLLSYIIKFIVFFSHFTKSLAKIKIGSYDEMKLGKKIKILLVGYNGARNTGADVRVVGIVQQLQKLFDPNQIKITIMTLNKKTLEGYFSEDVELLEFSSIFFIPLYKACSSHHIAILCEGSTLKSKFADALTMFFIEAAGIMKNQHKPCIAYGSEVGYMNPYLKKLSTTLCKDTYFITRTTPSYQALLDLKLNGHIGVDTAVNYHDEISKEEVMELLHKQGYKNNQKIMAVAIIDPFCWPVKASIIEALKGFITGNNEYQYDRWYYFSHSPALKAKYEKYIQEIARTINQYQDEYFIVILGMEKLDQKACQYLSSLLKYPSALFLSKDHEAKKIVGILRNIDLLITSRYHAAVLSMDHACPIVAISMDERLDGIMDELELASKYLCHVDDQNLSEQLTNMIQQAIIEKDMIHQNIHHHNLHYQQTFDQMGLFLKQYIEKGVNYE